MIPSARCMRAAPTWPVRYARSRPGYARQSGWAPPNYATPTQPAYPQPTASYGRNPSDTGSFGWAVLGFFIPLVGLILWMIWKNDRPGDAGVLSATSGSC